VIPGAAAAAERAVALASAGIDSAEDGQGDGIEDRRHFAQAPTVRTASTQKEPA
jgi:hypothetical protein